MKTTIRQATNDDLDLLMDIAVMMHNESPRYAKYKFSYAKMIDLYVRLIASDAGVVIVSERGDAIIGAIAGFVSEHWGYDEITANEFGLFVIPEFRGGLTAARLAKCFIAWAKEKGARMIQLGMSTGVEQEKTAALYRAIGLNQFSAGFEVPLCVQD